ncbi:UNVERIFIED_CONTAM: hypothetical protein HDU68_003127 [Siphonaria sp. JEL0065]|nr:hypothetical protein HDU68_003127 [Siphonaria sp. JEL0065]
MDPLVLLPQHVRALVASRDIPTLPAALREEFALVAIIDISGYSKLSSKLESELGSDSGAKIKEVINPPSQILGNEPTPSVPPPLPPAVPILESINVEKPSEKFKRESVIRPSSNIRKKQKQIDPATTDLRRIEYFIAGEALAKAGANLGVGKEGDFVFSKSFNEILKSAIGVSGMKVNNNSYIVSDKDPIVELRAKALKLLLPAAASKLELIRYEAELTSLKSRHIGYLPLATAYMDDSVSKIIGMGAGKVTDQLRSVSVVFIKFKFHSETVSEQKNLNYLQAAAVAIISHVKEYEGCIRQFNCDDKALTALLVWGLEGHAHEKGESFVAMLAATEIAKSLQGCLEDPNGFSIGVTTGVCLE